MKQLLCAALLTAGCTDEQNVGNTPPPSPVSLAAPRWVASFGDQSADDALSLALVSNGDVVVSGTVHGKVNFGGAIVDGGTTTSGSMAVLTRRAAADGHGIWTLGLDSNFAPVPQQIAIGPGDTIIALGFSWTTGKKLQELIAYYDTGGLMWHHALLPTVTATHIAVARDGRIAIGGTTTAALDVQTNPVDIGIGFTPAYVEMYAADGTPQWAMATNEKAFATPDISSLAFTDDGSLVVAGTFDGPISFGATGLQPAGVYPQVRDGFVVSFAPDAAVQWAHVLGDATHNQYPTNLAIDRDGHAIVGSTSWCLSCTNDHGAPLLQNLDARGEIARSLLPTWGFADQLVVASGSDGTLYASAITNGYDIDLGAGLIHASAYLAAFDPSGALSDAVGLGDRETGACQLRALATRPGTLAVAGHIGQSIDLGTGPLPYAGDTDFLVAAYDVPP